MVYSYSSTEVDIDSTRHPRSIGYIRISVSVAPYIAFQMNQLYHCLSIYPIVHTSQTQEGIQYAMEDMRRKEMMARGSLCCKHILASHLRIFLDIPHLSLTRLLILDQTHFNTSQCQDKITWRLCRSDQSTQII